MSPSTSSNKDTFIGWAATSKGIHRLPFILYSNAHANDTIV